MTCINSYIYHTCISLPIYNGCQCKQEAGSEFLEENHKRRR